MQPARDQHFIPEPQLSAPVDHEIAELLDQAAARQVTVEHNDHVSKSGGVFIEQPTACGYVNRLPDPIENDLVACGQQLNAADAGNHSKFKINSEIRDRFDDPDGGVIDGWIPPGEKPNGAPFLDLRADYLGVALYPGFMPGGDAGLIVGRIALPVRSSLRIRHFDDTIMIMDDERSADLLAQLEKVVFSRPFVGNEEYVHAVESRHSLACQMIRIPAADSDH